MTCSNLNKLSLQQLGLLPQSKIAVVMHDAGAANHIISWLPELQEQIKVYAAGPAKKLLQESGLKVYQASDLNDCLADTKLLISGTSWASDIEQLARIAAIAMSIPTVAVIDHWVNYPQRFLRKGDFILPDHIWVTDSYALKLANRLFPSVSVVLIKNVWMESLMNKVEAARKTLTKPGAVAPASRLIYFLEPLRDPVSGELNGGEFEAIRSWLSNISELQQAGLVSPRNKYLEILLRPHPSESPQKYQTIVNEYHGEFKKIFIDIDSSMHVLLASSDAAFGCETQALVAALNCMIPAYTTLLPKYGKSKLPHAELQDITPLYSNLFPSGS